MSILTPATERTDFHFEKMLCKKPVSNKETGLSFIMDGGEDGIRTHVELPPNGFQDRPVMTASVPLHVV